MDPPKNNGGIQGVYYPIVAANIRNLRRLENECHNRNQKK